jgi:hypothetical protein
MFAIPDDAAAAFGFIEVSKDSFFRWSHRHPLGGPEEVSNMDIQAMQSMDWLFKKERIYLLAQFWQQVSPAIVLYCSLRAPHTDECRQSRRMFGQRGVVYNQTVR